MSEGRGGVWVGGAAGQGRLGSQTAAAKRANIVPSAPRTDDVIARVPFVSQEPNKCCSEKKKKKKEQSEFDMCT